MLLGVDSRCNTLWYCRQLPVMVCVNSIVLEAGQICIRGSRGRVRVNVKCKALYILDVQGFALYSELLEGG